MELFANLERWSRELPDRPAHVGVNAHGARETLTYRDLLARAERLAAHLRAELPPDRSPLVVLGHKEPEMLVGFLGTVASGHPYIPLDDSLPAARIEAVVASAGARLTLTPARIAEICARPSAADVPRLTPPGPDDPFYIIFTSGSTGQPKGVQITSGCLQSFLDWLGGEQRFREGQETFLNQAPFSFDLSVMDLYGSLNSGGTLYSITRREIADFRALFPALDASGVTVWVSTPSFAQVCLLEKTFAAGRLPGARKFLFCGETLHPGTARQLLDRFPDAEVWNTYGPTEATVAATSVRVDRALLAREGPLPVGYPMPTGAIEIHDEEGRAQPAGERGEIVIAGPNVSPGYVGRPDLTAAVFFTLRGQRAYRTGDIGHFDEQGLLHFHGRRDGQIKLHGYRIELADIESNLLALPDVREAVVMPVERGGAPQWLDAYVTLTTGVPSAGTETASAARLRELLAGKLPGYMLPRSIHFVPALPLTAETHPAAAPAATPDASPAPPWPDITVLRSDAARRRTPPLPGADDGDDSSPALPAATPFPSTPAPPPSAARRRQLTPEETRAFLTRYLLAGQTNDTPGEIAFYGDRVDYFDDGVVDRRFIEADVARYDRRWPQRRFTLLDPVTVFASPDGAPDNFVAHFRYAFTNKGAHYSVDGKTDNAFTLQDDGSGGLRIIGMKEQRIRGK